MTVRELINRGAKDIEEVSDTSRLDSALLLSKVLGVDRAKLMALYPDQVNPENESKFLQYISIRKEGYPLSYIFKEKEFYGRTFYIEDGVLTPRPDTEVLIEETLKLIDNNNFTSCLDMCTGTGCIGITIKAEKPSINQTVSDISPIAERVTRKNSEALVNGAIKFIKSDLFTNIDGKFDIIVTNPPYLTREETHERIDIGWKEPTLALDGGEDGLDLIRIIIKECPNYLNSGGWLLIEASPWQMKPMEDLMVAVGFNNIYVIKDLPGFDRVIVGRYE